ncbi:Hpt domain-containing protein [Desulfovibrio mangrovi]|uniref:Hpt domain-containing protein n=1 Tax=Desulfovibrio mangrovi TaxID=2976983 RepID=UPI0022484349|nr:Hpt domain-containing protein [Desulfovibrio mangrovi]UZP68140.1 Hpt domain-containing protein [Desulfovibrio mangrovi]
MPQHLTINIEAALKRMGGDWELFALLLNTFQTDAPHKLQRIAERLAADDIDGARLASHSLKGAAATVGAEKVMQLASELEWLFYDMLNTPDANTTSDATATPACTSRTTRSTPEDYLVSINDELDTLTLAVSDI